MRALTEPLAAALGTSPDEADTALRAFADAVRARVQSGETASFPGLGTFRRGADGALAFEPDAALALVVNHRFAGLAPVPVAPAVLPLPLPAPDAAPVWPREGWLPEPAPLSALEPYAVAAPEPSGWSPSEYAPRSASPSAPGETADAPDLSKPVPSEPAPGAFALLPPAALSNPDRSEFAPPSAAPAVLAASALASEPPVTPAEAPYALRETSYAPPVDVPAPAASTPVRPPVPVEDEPVRRTRAPWLLPLLLLLAVGALVVWMLRRDDALTTRPAPPAPADTALARAPLAPVDPAPRDTAVLDVAGPDTAGPAQRPPSSAVSPGSTPTAPATPPPSTGSPAATGNARTPPSGSVDERPARSATATRPRARTARRTPARTPRRQTRARSAPPVPASVTTAESPAPTLAPDTETALRGRAPVVAGSGWTIIVGGALTEADAEVIAARYRAQGYRTGVLAGVTREGAAVWRVAVGQFGTSGPAGAALRQLRGTLPADAWLLRLR